MQKKIQANPFFFLIKKSKNRTFNVPNIDLAATSLNTYLRHYFAERLEGPYQTLRVENVLRGKWGIYNVFRREVDRSNAISNCKWLWETFFTRYFIFLWYNLEARSRLFKNKNQLHKILWKLLNLNDNQFNRTYHIILLDFLMLLIW